MSKMVGPVLKIRVDENEADRINKVKKIVSSTNENQKRALLGDLQNRAVPRVIGGAKEVAQKDLNEQKAKNALKTTKARVDTHWKKSTNSANNIGPAVIANVPIRELVQVPQRSRILTRSNSVHYCGNHNGTKAPLQRNASNNALLAQKPKTTTAPKVVESKMAQINNKVEASIKEEKIKNVLADAKLKREDSNLSRKSLAKLKAVLAQGVSESNRVAIVAPTQIILKAEPQAKKNEVEVIPKCQNVMSHTSLSARVGNDVEDIDCEDCENLVLVSEYVNDIYDYLYELEDKHFIRKNHLDKQLEVNAQMRDILIDWINEAHFQFHLVVETYHMAVWIIDRYLQTVENTKRSNLQLVGVTALFIAAKYEELFPPAISDFVYITDNTYTVNQILKMELSIFKALDYNLSRPLSIQFLRRYSKAAKAEDYHHTMSKYFLELATVDYKLASSKPSEIAAASLFLSLNLLAEPKIVNGFKNRLWTSTLEHYSRYSADHLRPLAKKIATLARNAPNAKLKSTYLKYQSSKLQKISLRPELNGVLINAIINSKD